MDALKLKIEAVDVVLQQLENAFQKREKDTVIELAIDRILHYIGVYLILLLAVLAKVSELIDENIACYPLNATHATDRAFMIYSNNYCWEMSYQQIGSTSAQGKQSDAVLQNAESVLLLYKWMPYFFLAEVLLFSLPSVVWHSMVGASLTGHMKFVLAFSKDLYESLHKIPAGVYRKLPYDAEGNYLDGWRPFTREYKERELQGQKGGGNSFTKSDPSSVPAILKTKPSERSIRAVLDSIVDPDMKEVDDGVPDDSNHRSHQESDKWTGNLRDRHLFSMLCYENLASLDYHPYIMSVYGLTSTAAAQGDRSGIIPLKQGILRQFCHEENFTSNFLAKSYIIRYIISILLSSILLVSCVITFASIQGQTFGTKSFICDIPLHNERMVCTLKGHWDVLALFIVNICILLIYLVMSLYQFLFVRLGSHRGLCYYFEDLNDDYSVALGSAYEAEKDE